MSFIQKHLICALALCIGSLGGLGLEASFSTAQAEDFGADESSFITEATPESTSDSLGEERRFGGKIENRSKTKQIALFCAESDASTLGCKTFQYKIRKNSETVWTNLGKSFSFDRSEVEKKGIADQVKKGRFPLSEPPSIDSLFVLIWVVNYFNRGHTWLGYTWRWGLTIAATPLALIFDGLHITGEAAVMGALAVYDVSSGAMVHHRVFRALKIASNPHKTHRTIRLADETYSDLEAALRKI